MIEIFKQKINGKLVLLFLFLYVISWSIGTFIILPEINHLSAGKTILDASFNYSSEDVKLLFDLLGDSGRSYYLVELLTFDIIHPFIVLLFFSTFLHPLKMLYKLSY
jgi:hypothetical protein